MTERAEVEIINDGTCKSAEFVPEESKGHKHDWLCEMNTSKTFYDFCLCGARRAWQIPDGYQPIDIHWITTGEWFSRTTLPDFMNKRTNEP